MMKLNVVFMGSPDFSLSSLSRLIDHYSVVGVVTQPDRPAGRGRMLTPPPVKELALSHGIPLIQPEKLRQPEALAQLQAWEPDLIVVTAFGQILRQNVLDLPRFGCINVHASILPRWRGAAPIQAAILAGDLESGVTIMRMDAGVDTGPILSQEILPIRPHDNTETLSQRLAEAGADLLIRTLPSYLNGETQPIPQPETGVTYAGMIKKESGQLDFQQPAEALSRLIRAFTPWPGAFMFLDKELFKIKNGHVANGPAGNPGERGAIDGLPAVCTSSGWLVLDEVQPAGKKPMPGDVYLRGSRNWR
jgi:methionyl-tRNA formyltransferase